MENNLQNKAKFVSQYYMQKIAFWTLNGSENKFCISGHRLVKSNIKGITLELTPLSLITNEDIKVVLEFLYKIYPHTKDMKLKESQISAIIESFTESATYVPEYNILFCQEVIDFLRSKSYCLPWMDLSVEQQIDFGWVKLRESR